MRREKLFFIVLVIALFIFIFGCCQPPRNSSVNIDFIPQHRDWWCWAATTEIISDYYGHQVDQCESANYIHGTPPDCCTGCTGDCPGWGSAWGASITDIKNNWTHWNFKYEYVSSSLSWDKLKNTISTSACCDKSPVQAIWWWTNGGGHVVVIYGYAEVGDQKYVSYFNPLPEDCGKKGNQCSPVNGGSDLVTTYEDFVSNTIHNWGDSFYSFEYTAP